jgi:hypothetical protein
MRLDFALFLAIPAMAVSFEDGYGDDPLFEESRFPLEVSNFFIKSRLQ